MNKEPFALYLLRFFVGLGILIFLGMLYWSSTLVEEGLLTLRSEVNSLRTELMQVRDDLDHIKDEHGQHPSEPSAIKTPTKKGALASRPHIDQSLPNLLEDDPYYQTTLPGQLGPHFKPYGTLSTTSTGKYDHLLPFAQWYEIGTWNRWCGASVANQLFGKFETLSPDLAIKMEERKNKEGQPEFWIHLRDKAYWQPLKKDFFPPGFELADHFLKKHQITSEDFKFYFDALMNPYISAAGAVALRPYFQDIVEFRIVDKLTFVVRWKEKEFTQPDGSKISKVKYVSRLLTGGLSPLASFVYQYYPNGKKIIEDDTAPNTYRKNAIWAQGFEQHWARNVIVSCGPMVFDGKSDRQINFRRNRDYYFPLAALTERREVLFKESPENAWQDFKSNNVSFYSIQPDQLLELQNFLKTSQYLSQAEQNSKIERLDFFARQFSYVGWNQKKPYFTSAKVRQALTMAVDRQRIIQQFLQGMGMELTGPMFPFDRAYDRSIQPYPFDLQGAKRLLEEEGWYDHDGDGIIDKNMDGKLVPFQFVLNYISRQNLSKGIAEYVSTSLREIGIDCRINGLDIPDISSKINDKNFDAMTLAWTLGSPPDDPRQLWYTDKGDEKGSSNYIGFSHAEVDQIIDALDYEHNPEKRIELYHRFHRIIHEEAPYIFLFVPKSVLLYRENVQNVFIPSERQDLIPGADVSEPDSAVMWLKEK